MKYSWVKKHIGEYAVTMMCKVLEVSPTGYYDWQKRVPSARHKRRESLKEAAAKFYFQSGRVYGYRKVHEDLLEEGVGCCKESVRKLLKEMGLQSRIKRRFKVTTDSKHSHPVAGNLLDRDFKATRPNEKWVTDITYIATSEGWLYLAAVMDLFSRRIVGWSMSERIDTSLVGSALEMALKQRTPDAGLLHHSDRGCQYAASDYRKRLDAAGIVCSMSRKGDCWDNACMERFFGSLKTERVYFRTYRTREDARCDVFSYIEMFYNRQRRHATLGYVSPATFEARHAATKQAG